MKEMRRIHLFRHGRTDWNVEGRIQGHEDIPLNEEGRAQARLLAEPLRQLGIQGILSSDMSRALETARIAASRLSVSIDAAEGLREIHLGKLQGLTRQEIEAKFGIQFSSRLRHEPLSDSEIAMLGSESGEAVIRRSLGAIRDYLLRTGFETIAVSTHGGVIRRVLQFTGPRNEFPPPIPNSVIFTVIYLPGEDRWKAENLTPWSAPEVPIQ